MHDGLSRLMAAVEGVGYFRAERETPFMRQFIFWGKLYSTATLVSRPLPLRASHEPLGAICLDISPDLITCHIDIISCGIQLMPLTQMTVEQYEARLAMIREAFDDNTKKLKNAERAGQSVPKATSVAFSQPKRSVLNASVRSVDKPSAFPPLRPAKRQADVIDMDSSDDESSGSFSPPRKVRKTSSSQSAGGIAKPWDQDHSKMKKPPRISMPGPEDEPGSRSSSKKAKGPRASINAHIELSVEQRGVLQLVLQGQSVFFTGSAGEATAWEVLRASDLVNRYGQVRIT